MPAALLALALLAAPAQPPARVDEPALVQALVAARTDADRGALADAHPDLVTQSLVRALLAEANKHMSARDAAPADAAYSIAFWVADRLDWPEGRARALIGRGTVAGQTGYYDEAIDFLSRAMAMSEGRNDQDVMTAANNLGIVHRLRGDYDQALESYDRALTLAKQSGREDTVSRALTNMGLVYYFKGAYRKALETLEESLRIKDKLSLPDIATTLNNIGNVHDSLGNEPLALAYYTRALESAERVNNRASQASTLSNIGEVKATRHQHDEALTYYRRALAIHEATGDRANAAIALQNIGASLKAQGHAAEAIDYLERSLAINETLGSKQGIASVLIDLARARVTRDDADGAAWLIGRAVTIAEDAGLKAEYFSAQTVAGDVALARGHLDAAMHAYTQAIEAIETLRLEVAGAAPDRARFFEDKLEPYYGLAAVHLRAGRLADAFAASERARARGLLDVLDGGERTALTLSPAERERERAIERAIVGVNAQIAAESARPRPDAARLATLRENLTAARLDREDLLARFYATHPDLQFARGETVVVTAGQASRALDRDAALVEFVLTPTDAWALVVTPGAAGADITAHRLNTTRANLDRAAAAFRRQLASRDLAFAAQARRLYRVLLAPVERRLAGRRLVVIVPDGPLWQLPFQALVNASGRYLIEDHPVAYAASASALTRLRMRRATSGHPSDATLLAIGDPASPAGAPGLRSTGTLKDASRELQAIAALYGSNAAHVFTGAGATEARFREEAARASVVHIATHGTLDDGNAMYSFLALAGNGGGENADGRLEAREIRELQIPADVAVLSACDTALGRIRSGEGIVGLSWSLFAAGAASAVVSQWKVDSASTADLMIALHTNMRASDRRDGRMHPAESLQRAALAVMRDARYRHPFYWAGFLVIGVP